MQNDIAKDWKKTNWQPIISLEPIQMVDALNLQAEMSQLCKIIYQQHWENFWGYIVYDLLIGGKWPRQNKKTGFIFSIKEAKECLERIRIMHYKFNIWIGHDDEKYCCLDQWKKEYASVSSFTCLKNSH